jgi:hypothetical protein
MGIPRIAGRDFENESATSLRTAVVNEQFVQRLLGNENPIGQRVRDGGRVYEIMGVVKNTKSRVPRTR